MATNKGNDVGFALDWEDEIEKDGGTKFVLLDEGDYDFEVTKMERGSHNGSTKVPPCNKAIITIGITSEKGSIELTDGIPLHSKMEWKLCQFFTAIGHRKHGEKLKMDWKKVVGSTGKVHIKKEPWTGDDGVERESNKIDFYIDPEKYAAQKEFTAGTF